LRKEIRKIKLYLENKKPLKNGIFVRSRVVLPFAWQFVQKLSITIAKKYKNEEPKPNERYFGFYAPILPIYMSDEEREKYEEE